MAILCSKVNCGHYGKHLFAGQWYCTNCNPAFASIRIATRRKRLDRERNRRDNFGHKRLC